MGWETRNGHGRYYTRSVRVKGRVKREYVGSGQLAEAISTLDLADRLEKEEEAAERRVQQEMMEEMDRKVDAACVEVEELMRGVLVASGYHRHKQGEWRKRRD